MDLLQPIIEWAMALPHGVLAASVLVTIASVVSALSPTIKNSSKWVWVQKVLDILAFNIAKAKDK